MQAFRADTISNPGLVEAGVRAGAFTLDDLQNVAGQVRAQKRDTDPGSVRSGHGGNFMALTSTGQVASFSMSQVLEKVRNDTQVWTPYGQMVDTGVWVCLSSTSQASSSCLLNGQPLRFATPM